MFTSLFFFCLSLEPAISNCVQNYFPFITFSALCREVGGGDGNKRAATMMAQSVVFMGFMVELTNVGSEIV